MKTVSLLLGASLLFAPTLARAEGPLPAPVVASPAPVYFVPSWSPVAPAPSGPAAGYVGATRRRNTGLMISGIALAGLGLASLFGGAVMLGEASHGATSCSETLCLPKLDADVKRTEGTLLTLNGGLMMASGVAMAIAGGWQVPVAGGAAAAGAKSFAPSMVAVGPGTATVRWSF